MREQNSATVGAREIKMPVRSEASRQSMTKRKGEIAAILVRYEIPVEELFPGRHLRKQKIDHSRTDVNKRWRLALQELGPTFIKFGQMMSTRPDLVSPELATELKTLTDNVKTVPWEPSSRLLKSVAAPSTKLLNF